MPEPITTAITIGTGVYSLIKRDIAKKKAEGAALEAEFEKAITEKAINF